MTDVFDQNTNVPPVVVDSNVSSDPFADKLKEIVNEQGQPKYKDTNAALEALKASQEHIKRLEAEKQAEKAIVDAAAAEKVRADALEDIVKRMTGNSPQTPKQVETTTNAGTSEEATIKLLEKVLAARDNEAEAKKNSSNVQNALLAKFGDMEKTKLQVAAKAKELGMTPQELGTLSSKNPQLVLTVFGLTATTPAQGVVPSSTPFNAPQTEKPLERPTQSIISGIGATDRNRKALMAKIKEDVYKKFQVET